MTAGLVAALLVATGATTSSAPAAHRDAGFRNLDLVASANPTPARLVVNDDAYADVAVRRDRRSVQSDVTATGTAICNGCVATSTALQVLYVGRGQGARLDNTAAAWTQDCGDCSATALSVQVVVLRRARLIEPNNRALAVNAGCTSCAATSAAFQVVVSSRHQERLSRAALAELRAWVDEQVAALRAAAPTAAPSEGASRKSASQLAARKKAERRAQRVAVSALDELEGLVTGDLGAATVSSDVELGR